MTVALQQALAWTQVCRCNKLFALFTRLQNYNFFCSQAISKQSTRSRLSRPDGSNGRPIEGEESKLWKHQVKEQERVLTLRVLYTAVKVEHMSTAISF